MQSSSDNVYLGAVSTPQARGSVPEVALTLDVGSSSRQGCLSCASD